MTTAHRRVSQPNPSYYDSRGGKRYMFGEIGANPKLAKFGADNRLRCGGHWILGEDFAFCIDYAADGYNHLSSVSEFGPDSTERWHELKRHLCIMDDTKSLWHTLKSRNEVARDLGLPTCQTCAKPKSDVSY